MAEQFDFLKFWSDLFSLGPKGIVTGGQEPPRIPGTDVVVTPVLSDPQKLILLGGLVTFGGLAALRVLDRSL